MTNLWTKSPLSTKLPDKICSRLPLRRDRRQDAIGSTLVSIRGLRVFWHYVLGVIQRLDLPSRRELVLVRAIVSIRDSGGIVVRGVVRWWIQRVVAPRWIRVSGCQHLGLRVLVVAVMVRQQGHDCRLLLEFDSARILRQSCLIKWIL